MLRKVRCTCNKEQGKVASLHYSSDTQKKNAKELHLHNLQFLPTFLRKYMLVEYARTKAKKWREGGFPFPSRLLFSTSFRHRTISLLSYASLSHRSPSCSSIFSISMLIAYLLALAVLSPVPRALIHIIILIIFRLDSFDL